MLLFMSYGTGPRGPLEKYQQVSECGYKNHTRESKNRVLEERIPVDRADGQG